MGDPMPGVASLLSAADHKALHVDYAYTVGDRARTARFYG